VRAKRSSEGERGECDNKEWVGGSEGSVRGKMEKRCELSRMSQKGEGRRYDEEK
jgi:hypothetical protein